MKAVSRQQVAGIWKRIAGSWERVAGSCRLQATGYRLLCVSLFSFFIFHFSFCEAQSYDFSVRMVYGDTLYFEITDPGAKAVKLVPPQGGVDPYGDHRRPSGVLVIPEQVNYRGKSYTVTAIGERAFVGCTRIRIVELPSTVERIENSAFYGCTGLNERVRIGRKVQYIGGSAFYGCTSLPEVVFGAENCSFMGGTMGSTAFGNCTSLSKVVIEEGVKRIPDYAFCGADALKDTLGLPKTLTYIGEYAFAFCNSLSGYLTIPDSVTVIGECAFHQCHTLRGVTIGASVKEIGARAFYHCVGLKNVRVRAYNPPALSISAFSNLSKGVKFAVPCVSKSQYEKDGFWKKQGPFTAEGNCAFIVRASMDNPTAGRVKGGGRYRYGDSVELAVVCAADHYFASWSDGSRENPRMFVADNDYELMAITGYAGEARTDTLYRVDTVYADGYRLVHDTVDMFDVVKSINDITEFSYDPELQYLEWRFPKDEKVLSVAVYNTLGECLYITDSRSGGVKLSRFPSGSYIVRIETARRVLRGRVFRS
jgi:hypothetical protein